MRQGDILLTDGKYDAAIGRFDAALAVSPDHRGALMGKGIAFLQSDRPAQAEAVFTHLIDMLPRTLAADDTTGRGVLSGAYANRGILHDRLGRYEAALADYRQALAIDPEAVEGPGLLHRILYGDARPAAVRQRAAYLNVNSPCPRANASCACLNWTNANACTSLDMPRRVRRIAACARKGEQSFASTHSLFHEHPHCPHDRQALLQRPALRMVQSVQRLSDPERLRQGRAAFVEPAQDSIGACTMT